MYIRISNKRKVILCGTKRSGISYDIEHPLLMLDRAFRPVYLQKFKVGSQKSVTLLWLQGRPTAEGDIFSVLLTSYDLLFFLFPSIRYFVNTFI